MRGNIRKWLLVNLLLIIYLNLNMIYGVTVFGHYFCVRDAWMLDQQLETAFDIAMRISKSFLTLFMFIVINFCLFGFSVDFWKSRLFYEEDTSTN